MPFLCSQNFTLVWRLASWHSENLVKPLKQVYIHLGENVRLKKDNTVQQNMKLALNNFQGQDSHINDLPFEYGKKEINFVTEEYTTTSVFTNFDPDLFY